MIFRKLAAALGLLGLLLPAAAGAQATSSGPTARIYVPAIAANGGTGNNITLNGTTNITGTASNAVTQPFTDASARIATDAYVQSVQQVTRSTVYLNGVTGGTLSFASLGTGAAFSFTATGGVITSINSVFAGGSGYKVGDVIYITRGNYDNYILVTGVSGTAITSVQILNGGTGNTSGLDVSAMAAIESPIIYNVSGTLTSNLQVIASNGPVLGYSGVFLLINNTTGAYTESVCISNGSDACNGNGSVQIPQGAANSCATLTYTDGSTPWLVAPTECGAAIFSTMTANGTITDTNASASTFNIKTTGTNSPSYAFTVNDAANAGVLSNGSGTIVTFNSNGTSTWLHSMTLSGASITAFNIMPSGSTAASNGLYLPAANTLGFSTSTTAAGLIDANQHWRFGGSGTPTIASGACGTGTNGTIAANGNDQSFEVLIGSAATTTCTITFASAFTTAPRAAALTPADAAAAAVGTTVDYISTLNTTTLVITGAALANTQYYVHVF